MTLLHILPNIVCKLLFLLISLSCTVHATPEPHSTIEPSMVYIVDTLRIEKPCHIFVPYASCNIMFVMDSIEYEHNAKKSIEELIESPAVWIELGTYGLSPQQLNLPNNLSTIMLCSCLNDPYFQLDSVQRLDYDNRLSQYYLLMFMRADCLHTYLYSCIAEYNENISLREKIFRQRHFVNKDNPYRYYKVVVPLCDDAITRMRRQHISTNEWLQSLYME